MRIVHAPTEIAGQMGILIEGLRKAGYTAFGYNWFHTYLNYRNHHVVKTEAYELMKMVDPLVHHADLFHFHNGNSLLVHNADVPMIHSAGKKMVMHHWGNDVRTVERNKMLNRYELPSTYLSDEQIIARLKHLSTYIQHAIVQDYELYPHVSDYYEHVHIIPLICNTAKIPYAYPLTDQKKPVIIHAPTNRAFKGSEYVELAINDMRGKVEFDYQTIEKTNHEEAMRRYLQADIIVDQILCGTYGMLSVEAMAMGKVVVAYIRDDVRQQLPSDLPIVVASPDDIQDVLTELVRDPERRRQIGVASRAYVQRYHSTEYVIPRLLDIYAKIATKEA